MSGPMIAHMLKQVGLGSEITGLVVLCGFGGVLGGATFCALQGLAVWALERRADGLRARRYLPNAGMAD